MSRSMTPAEVVRGFRYAIFNDVTGNVTGSLYTSVHDATDVCEVMNRTYLDDYNPYEVVEIDHDTNTFTCVDADGNLVDGSGECPMQGECGMWRDMIVNVFDYVQRGVEDAESGGFDSELPAYRVVLAYMLGLLHANGVTDIG